MAVVEALPRNYLWLCPCMAPHSVRLRVEGSFERGDSFKSRCPEDGRASTLLMLREILENEPPETYPRNRNKSSTDARS